MLKSKVINSKILITINSNKHKVSSRCRNEICSRALRKWYPIKCKYKYIYVYITIILIRIITCNTLILKLCFSEPEVRDHLSKVYSCLTVTTALSAAGAIVHSYNIWEAGFLSAFGTLAIIIGLTLTPDNGKNSHIRLGMLWGFGFLSGHTLGPLIDHVIDLNPAILVNALISTAVVFISFSISALLAKRGSFLFLGGLCLSVLTTLSLFGIANIFLQSQAIYQV